MDRLKLFIPLALFIPLGWLLIDALPRNPQDLPSALIGKPLPEFNLPTLRQPDRSLARADLVGKKILLNVWGSWCPSCRAEHPWLMKLANEQGIAIYGLNYKDDRDKALVWLERYKDPYVLNIFDTLGRLGLDLGVTGAPETFMIDADGIIRYRHVGVVDQRVWENKLQALWESLP